MSRSLQLKAIYFDAPNILEMLKALNEGNWSAGAGGFFLYSISDFDLTDEILAESAEMEKIIQVIQLRLDRKQQAAFSVSHPVLGSINICFTHIDSRWVVSAFYACEIQIVDGKFDLNAAQALLYPCLVSASNSLIEYSLHVFC